MFVAAPMYCAMMPSDSITAPPTTMSATNIEAQPLMGRLPTKRPQATHSAARPPSSTNATPMKETKISGLVPEEITSRPKCENSRR